MKHSNFLTGWLILGIFLSPLGCHTKKAELPNLGSLPIFELVNQEKQKVSLEDYKGKIWVANFIFTSCAGTCPMLTQRMKKLQDEIKKIGAGNGQSPIRLVSFSVDPETDTPERLKEYSAQYGVDYSIWSFLTGPLDQITQTVVKGFKISMGKVPLGAKMGKATAEEIFEVVHGEKFVLVDQHGEIRGYYDSKGPGLKKLIADLKQLISEAS